MADFRPLGSIASVAPTVAHLFATMPPRLSSEPPLAPVIDYQARVLGSAPVEKCLIFCPDALGAHVWTHWPDYARVISQDAPVRVPLLSVVPTKTPVCFASMFSGGHPHQHGIRQYERPVLKCDTLFDALIRGNKKVAIIAVTNSSMDLIFRERPIDYFSEGYDRDVEHRAVQLIRENRHDLVVVYQQEYDDLLHQTDPFSEACLQAAAHHVDSFTEIASTASHLWSGSSHAVIFAPDHGAHVDPNTGHGDHGADISEDMQLYHWYGIRYRIM